MGRPSNQLFLSQQFTYINFSGSAGEFPVSAGLWRDARLQVDHRRVDLAEAVVEALTGR
jgi:hypothetical protein